MESDSLPDEVPEDGPTVHRKDRVNMSHFVVQVSGSLPPHDLERGGGAQRHTVLRATLRDQAALYGYLKVLNDLGLDLLDLRRLPGSGTTMSVEVVIRGSIDDVAMSAVSDHVEVTHRATRLVLTDRLVLDQVLDWAREAGAAVEYAVDAPPSSAAVGEAPG